MGNREWGVLIRSHEDLKRLLDVIDLHNRLCRDPAHYNETGEEIDINVVLRFRGAVYVALGAGGGGGAITAFLKKRLPLAVHDPFQKPQGWDRVRDYPWAARSERDSLRRDAAPGTRLYATLSTAFANPAPVECRPEFFDANRVPSPVTRVSQTFDDVLGLSGAYLGGTGRSFVHTAPAALVPAIAASLMELEDLTRLGFAFFDIAPGEQTSTQRRRAMLRMLCLDADALDVCRALFDHGALAVHALLSDGPVVNNLPNVEKSADAGIAQRSAGDPLFNLLSSHGAPGAGSDILSALFGGNPLEAWECPLQERSGAGGRWTTVAAVKHDKAIPVGTILARDLGFKDPGGALKGVALLTVVGREWGPLDPPLPTQLLEAVQLIRGEEAHPGRS